MLVPTPQPPKPRFGTAVALQQRKGRGAHAGAQLATGGGDAVAGGTAAGGEAFGREDVGGEVRAAVQQEEPGDGHVWKLGECFGFEDFLGELIALRRDELFGF